MALPSETAKLLVDLNLVDNLSGPLTAAQGKLTAVGAEAEAASGKVGLLGNAFSSMGKALAIGAAGFAAFEGLHILGDAVSAATEEEASIRKLTQALQANVPAWNGDIDAIEKNIKAREQLGFTDDALRQSFTVLVAATHDVAEAQKVQAEAMDLARFKGISLEEASQALVTVEAGRYRSLAALGIQIKANATQEQALAEVQKVVAGQAESYANTTAGKLEAANAAINDSMEKLGSALLPAVATGMQALATVVGGVTDVFKTFGDILGGVGDNVGGFIDNLTKLGGVSNREAQATIAYNLALTQLQTQFAEGKISQDEYIAKSKQLEDSFNALIQNTQGFTTATESSGEALDNIGGRAEAAAQALLKVNASVFKGSDYFKQFTTDAKDTGAGLDNVDRAARAATDALNAIPKNIDVTVSIGFITNGKGGVGTAADFSADQLGSSLGYAQPNAAGGSALASQLQSDRNAREQAAAAAAKARQQAIDAAASKAKAQALAEQRALTQAITDTYRTAKGLEDDYFARAHANRLKQIQDTLALAQAQHDAAVKAINDALQTQLANNAKPVTAAQAALTNTQNQEQLRNLQEAADAAFTALQQNTDPAQAQQLQRALRDAREALANFKAQLNITNLQATQNAADAKAKADAQAKIAAADAVLAAADSKAKKDTLTENQRYATIQKRFNDDLDKVLKETIKKHKSMNDALQALIQLIAHFGGTSAGIPKVKQGIEVPKEGQQIHVTVNVPPITIGARAVTNALSTQITPSQSPYVRTGQTRPKFSPGS